MFYTYLWLRYDGTPYYVGKGREERAWVSGSHRLNRPKFDFLIIVQEFPCEQDAFAAERFLIAYYGRKDLGTGCLRNLTDGGEGASGAVLTEEHKAAIGKSTSERLRKIYDDPVLGGVERTNNSERLREYFKDPEARARASRATKLAFSKPEVISAIREGQRKRFDNPVWIAKHSEGQRKRFERPEERAKAAERSRKCAGSIEAREKNAAAQRKLWEDPEYRAWMTDKRRNQPKRRINMAAPAFSADGKIVNVNDQVSIVGLVVSVSGTGSLAVITVETALTPNTFAAQANDMNAVQTEGVAKSISGKAFGFAGDQVSVLGRVSAISGSGNTAALSVVLKTSGNTITVPAGVTRSAQFNG